MYDLISVVIHCGSGLSRGHYISIVKSHGMWVLFDDDIVDVSSPHFHASFQVLFDTVMYATIYMRIVRTKHCCPFLLRIIC